MERPTVLKVFSLWLGVFFPSSCCGMKAGDGIGAAFVGVVLLKSPGSSRRRKGADRPIFLPCTMSNSLARFPTVVAHLNHSNLVKMDFHFKRIHSPQKGIRLAV